MTDHPVPDVTDDERRRAHECAEFIKSDMSAWGDGIRALVRVFLNAFPAPPRPTLADMTDEERAACQWMLCDVEDHSRRYVIANPSDEEGDAALIAADGEIEWMFPEYVTPRPDLPRLEWPGTENPAPAPALPEGWRLADHPDHGRVLVTSPAPDRDGDLWGFRSDDTREGAERIWCKPDELTYIDTEPEADK